MYLNNRLRRLELAHVVVEADGMRPCRVCANGENRQIVVRFAGDEPFPPLPTCSACGRDIAFIMNILPAEPVAPHHQGHTPQ